MTNPVQIPDAAVQAALDTRLKAAGMYTIEEIMAGTPVDKWRIHSGMNNLQFFNEWLERKAREYKVMAAGYDLGDKDKSDELYEWVLAHSGAFHDVLVNFRAATVTNEGTKTVDVAAVRRQAFEEAATLIDEGFEKAVGKPWRNDGKSSKNDRCPHDKFMYEDCENCASAAIRALSAEPASEAGR